MQVGNLEPVREMCVLRHRARIDRELFPDGVRLAGQDLGEPAGQGDELSARRVEILCEIITGALGGVEINVEMRVVPAGRGVALIGQGAGLLDLCGGSYRPAVLPSGLEWLRRGGRNCGRT